MNSRADCDESTLVISIIRLTSIDTSKADDFTYDSWMSACFSIAELASGISCAALATLRPLAGRLFPNLLSSSSDSAVRYDPDCKRPPTIGSEHTDPKSRGRVSSNEKAWAVDVYDNDLSWAYSPPGTPRVSVSGGRDRDFLHRSMSVRAFQMLRPRFGSITSILSPKTEGRLTFLDMDDETPTTPVKSGIVIERKFEVRSSDDQPRDTTK